MHNVATKVRAVEMSLFPDVKPGISEFEDEFLAFICLPSGQTMADVARPAIADAYASGSMPALTMGGGR